MAQSNHGNTSRRQGRDDASSMVSGRFSESDWEAKQAMCQRELEEARARTAQMEKTMRWWSDCTANWREKWSKVRSERNKARDEVKQLRTKLDATMKEVTGLKLEKQELEAKLLEAQLENEKLISLQEQGICNIVGQDVADITQGKCNWRNKRHLDINLDSPGVEQQITSKDSHKLTTLGAGEFTHSSDNILANRFAELKIKLDNTAKSLEMERGEKSVLLEKISLLRAEIQEARCNDQTFGSNESSHSEVERLHVELQDEIAAKQVLEEQQVEYRDEIERLKGENTIQWSKREMLETENISILRENKKLYSEICELKEQMHKLNRISDGSGCCLSPSKINLKKNSDIINVFLAKNTADSVNSQQELLSNGSSDCNVINYEDGAGSNDDDEIINVVDDDEKVSIGS